MAKALKHRPDAVVVTKIGIGIDEQSKVLSFDKMDEVDGLVGESFVSEGESER